MEEMLRQAAAVREEMGWFDRSAMGMLAVTGPDRYTWLQGMVSSDVRLLQSGKAARQLSCILDPTGHLLAEITLIDVPEDHYVARQMSWRGAVLIETPPGLADHVGGHLLRYLIMEEAEVVNVSEAFRCTTVQGPAHGPAQPALDAFSELALIVAADHTGSGGVDVYNLGANDTQYRDNLKHFVATEVGEAAQELLRIEAGIPKFGVDMDASTLAPEAGLMATHISLTKGCYVGQEIVARIDSRGHTNRELTGFLALDGTLPAAGEKLFAAEAAGGDKEVGWITSVAPAAPSAGGRAIALGYLRHEQREPGTRLRVGAPDSGRAVAVAELPFYRKPAS
jgi:folate-binding protein YgfZ